MLTKARPAPARRSRLRRVKEAGVPKWIRLLTNVSLPAGFLAIMWFGGNWSSSQAAAVFGLYGLCFGAFQQFRRPATPVARRVFALLFVLVCVGALLVGDRANADDVVIAIACVGGWTVGVGLAASFDPNDGAPVKRSFSGQVIRRG